MDLRLLMALSYVGDHDGAPQHELVDALCMDAKNVVLLLNELEDGGYLVRRRRLRGSPSPPRAHHRCRPSGSRARQSDARRARGRGPRSAGCGRAGGPVGSARPSATRRRAGARRGEQPGARARTRVADLARPGRCHACDRGRAEPLTPPPPFERWHVNLHEPPRSGRRSTDDNPSIGRTRYVSSRSTAAFEAAVHCHSVDAGAAPTEHAAINRPLLRRSPRHSSERVTVAFDRCRAAGHGVGRPLSPSCRPLSSQRFGDEEVAAPIRGARCRARSHSSFVGPPENGEMRALGETQGGPRGGRRALRLCFRGHRSAGRPAAASVRKRSCRRADDCWRDGSFGHTAAARSATRPPRAIKIFTREVGSCSAGTRARAAAGS